MSTRKNGDRLLGFASERALERYESGSPPVHGLAAGSTSRAVGDVRVGDELLVERRDDRWFVTTAEGVELGRLRWGAALDGSKHAVSGRRIRLPATGVLVVERLLVSPDGVVKDLGGYVR